MGSVLPVLGVGYYAACALGRVDPAAGMRAILRYLLAPGADLGLRWISACRDVLILPGQS
jgi:hypothetical protein